MVSINVLIFVFLLCIATGVVGLVTMLAFFRRLSEVELKVQQLESRLRELRANLAAPQREATSVSTQPVTVCAAPPPPPPPTIEAPRREPAVPAPGPAIPVTRHLPPPRHEATLDSIESLVGTRWLNWIGALVVLVGIAFLLKFLYDRGWIGPAGRVGIGLASGVGLLLLSEIRLRKVHDMLSQSVSAAGCGALFLTTFLAFKFYDFGGRLPTFGLLCWFAGFTVTLAVIRNARILAYLGLLGAYLTPYLLSTGQDQGEALFCYLAVLAMAAAFVNTARGWPGVSSLCLVLTLIYYAGWYSRFHSPQRLYVAAAGAGGLIILLGGLSLVRGLWNRSTVRFEECVVLLCSGLIGLYYLWDLLIPKHPAALGFILCGIALVALAGLSASRRRRASDPILENILLGLAAGTLLLVIPACLEASGAMLAWALAAVLLSDIGTRSRRWVLEIAAAVALVAVLVAGMAEPVKHTGVFMPMINRVFAPWFCAVLAWFIAGARFSRTYRGIANRCLLGPALQVASCFMMLALLSYEAAAWFAGRLRLPGADAAGLHEWRTAALCLLWALYPAIWIRWAKNQPKLWKLAAAHYAVMGFGLLALLQDFHRRDVLVFLNPAFLAALLYPAGVFLVSCRIVDVRSHVRNGLQIYGHILAVILLSVEIYQGLFLPSEYDASRYWIRITLISAVWAVYATAVLGIGISRNLPAWRWLALALLGITLVKVLLIDMAEVRQIWRVLSFLVLGALLMACSYAYSRRDRKRKLEAKPPETR